jgi:hypothetical protein
LSSPPKISSPSIYTSTFPQDDGPQTATIKLRKKETLKNYSDQNLLLHLFSFLNSDTRHSFFSAFLVPLSRLKQMLFPPYLHHLYPTPALIIHSGELLYFTVQKTRREETNSPALASCIKDYQFTQLMYIAIKKTNST